MRILIVLSILSYFRVAHCIEITVRKSPAQFHTFDVNTRTQNDVTIYQYNTAEQMLLSVSGISSPSTNRLSEVSVWGNRAGHNLVLIDGVPHIDSSHLYNNFNLEAVDHNTVDSLTVVKGVEALMQPGSLGGLIAVQSTQTLGSTHTKLRGDVDQKGSQAYYLAHAGQRDTWSHLISVNHQSTRPNSIVNPKHHNRINNRYRKEGLSTINTYNSPDRLYKGFIKYQLLKTELGLNDYAISLPIISPHHRTVDQHELHLKQNFYSQDFKQQHSVDLLYHTTAQHFDRPEIILVQKSRNIYGAYRFDYQWANDLKTMFNISHMKAQTSLTTAHTVRQNQTVATLNALFGDEKHAALNINFIKNITDIKKPILGQFMGTLKVSSKTMLKSGVGWGRQSPSLYAQNGHPAFSIQANHHLRDEAVRIAEVAVHHGVVPDKVDLAARLFQLNYSNLIVFDPVNNIYVNNARRTIYGVEMGTSYAINPQWFIQGAYTYLWLDNHVHQKSYAVPYVPCHKLMGRIKWLQTETLTIFIEPTLTVQQSNHYVDTRQHRHSNFYLRAGLTNKLNNNISINFRIENVTNTRHEVCYGYGSSPLTLYMGCRVQW